ncbi:leucyl aminopeptidase family protein [Colwellia piezophila]|uniref:leucyl aminopeptidase family protein n=1 Tax=Colwellia piezophila TaxID=211668 RepID=UPI0003679495|nr:leucyl aminopeptidase family protein [Colwellia piezophila]
MFTKKIARRFLPLTSLALTLAFSANINAALFDFTEKSKPMANDTIVVFQAGDEVSPDLTHFIKQSNKQVSRALAIAKFSGKAQQVVEVIAPWGIKAQRLVVMGLGDITTLTEGEINKLGAELSARMQKLNVKQVKIFTRGIVDSKGNASFAAQFSHGINLRDYKFDKYLSTEKKPELHYQIAVKNAAKTKQQYSQLAAIEQGVFLARDLTSEVPSEMTPVDFANAALELQKLGVKVTILGPDEIKALGMGVLHAVGRGSDDGARLVVAHWQGSNETPIALVGKGITFDSGGYNIKTGSSMARMKSDMAGAAAVLGTVKAMALQKAKVNVVAVMPMAANMVSATSFAPGDVLMSAEGLSIEVLNTDAEGRLILADGMWYAREKFEVNTMIDIATLTGSKIRAVGNRYSAIFTDDASLLDELTASGERVDEKVWRLPLAYKDMLKTPIADLRNTGSGGPGASTAAAFLQHFSGDTQWAHLDIAGNALMSKGKGVTPAGGTGHGVRLLSHWLLTHHTDK